MTKRNPQRNHVRVYLSDDAYKRVKTLSEKTRTPIATLIEIALERNTIEARDYLLHQAARSAYIATAVSLQVAAKILPPEDLKLKLEKISGSFTATFGSLPPMPEEIRRRLDDASDRFVLDLADLLNTHVDVAETSVS